MKKLLVLFFRRSLALVLLAALPALAAEPRITLKSFALEDQFQSVHRIDFPRTNLILLTVADRAGSEKIDPWIAALKDKLGGSITIEGIADVSAVPTFLRSFVRGKFAKARPHPVMLDWSGEMVRRFNYTKNEPNLYLVLPDGVVAGKTSGPFDREKLNVLIKTIQEYQQSRQGPPRGAATSPAG